MKKILAGILALVLCLGVVGCGGESTTANNSKITPAEPSERKEASVVSEANDEKKYLQLINDALATLGEMENVAKIKLGDIKESEDLDLVTRY